MKSFRYVIGILTILAALAIPGWQPVHAAGPGWTHLVFGDGSTSMRLASHPDARPSATTAITANAAAPSKSGIVAVTVSKFGSAQLSLIVSVGKQSFSFTIPSSDFTTSGNTATLNTHGDLKSYGTINITWSQKSTTRPKGSCGTPTPGFTYVYYSNPKGTASLKLPCVGSIASSFNGNYTGSSGYVNVPSAGYFSGAQASANLTLSSSASAYLQAYKGSASSQKPQVAVELDRTFTASASNPLTGHFQQLHVTLSGSALSFTSGLNSAALNMTSGPSPFKNTKLSWTATTPATGPTKDTCLGKWVGGGERNASITGTFGIQTCILTGKYTIKTSATTTANLYSSAIKAQATPALKLVSSSPKNGATGVPTSTSSVSATFSNALKSASGYLQGASVTDIQTFQTSQMSNGNKTVTFQLQQSLQPNTTYTLNIYPSDVYSQYLTTKIQFKTGS